MCRSPRLSQGGGGRSGDGLFCRPDQIANIAKLHELPSGRAAICNGSKQDAGFRNMMAQYEKASGNTIDVSIVPIAPMRQKIVSALTGPDLMEDYNAGRDGGPAECPER